MKFNKKLIISFLASFLTFSWTFAAWIDHFEVKFNPDAAKVWEALDLEIEAVDKNSDTVLDYKWTILIFSETDPEAVLPSWLDENTYTFKASDQWKIKFENWVSFKKDWLQDIHVYDLNDDTINWIAEAQITKDDTSKNLDISIASPENWITIWTNSISVSWLTQKNYKVKIIVNWKDEYQTASNNEWVFEKTVENLVDWENTFKAVVIDANQKEVWESSLVKIKFENSNLWIKSVKVNPDKVDPESSYEAEVIANPKLAEVSVIIDDIVTLLKETKDWVYTAKLTSPKTPWTYKVDVKVKDDLWHDKTELGATSLIVNELKAAVEEPIEVKPVVAASWTWEKVCSENVDYKITWLKLVELKTKSVLTWDKIEWVESYNIYKKLANWEFELVENVKEPKFEIEITWDEVKYDYFWVKAVAKNDCSQMYEWSLSDATKIKTWPETIILLFLSLLAWWFFVARRKNA